MTLAFGIGANASNFTLIDGLLLRGLPVPEPVERMIQLTLKDEQSGAAGPAATSLSYPLFEDEKGRAHRFTPAR